MKLTVIHDVKGPMASGNGLPLLRILLLTLPSIIMGLTWSPGLLHPRSSTYPHAAGSIRIEGFMGITSTTFGYQNQVRQQREGREERERRREAGVGEEKRCPRDEC